MRAEPPANAARMPETTYQRPVTTENVETAGLSAVPGSSVAIPIPTPSMVSRTWTTRATTTPAKMAPQETWLSRRVLASSLSAG